MPQSQRDVRNRIGSVANIQKITRAMEMVAAARLRRAEQRIEALRPYADAIRRMTAQAAAAAGQEATRFPLLRQHESENSVGLLLVTGDRGLAGAFNSQIIRAGVRRAGELSGEGRTTSWYATGRRGVSSVSFRGNELNGSYTGFSDRPAYADARGVAGDLPTGGHQFDGVAGRVSQVENDAVSARADTGLEAIVSGMRWPWGLQFVALGVAVLGGLAVQEPIPESGFFRAQGINGELALGLRLFERA